MKRGNLLQDPQLSALLAEAESVFAAADPLAESMDLKFTDSNVRIILLQALSQETRAQHSRLRKKELFYNEVEAQLAAKFEALQTLPEPVSRETWRLILQAMLDHIETESPRVRLARPYLDQICRAVR